MKSFKICMICGKKGKDKIKHDKSCKDRTARANAIMRAYGRVNGMKMLEKWGV